MEGTTDDHRRRKSDPRAEITLLELDRDGQGATMMQKAFPPSGEELFSLRPAPELEQPPDLQLQMIECR